MLQRSIGLVLIALALSGSSAFVGSCKTRGFQTSSIQKSSDAGAMARWLKAQDSLVPVQETMRSQFAETDESKIYKKLREDDEANNGKQLAIGIRDVRPELVALSKEDGTRDLLETSVIAEQRFRSERLKQVIFGGSGAGIRYDTIILGAGPHAAALVQEFTNVDPSRSILVVDARSRPGGTFADVGPVFALNSTNREDTGKQPNVGTAQTGGPKGDGNLNAIADIIGIPDFSGLRWPLAGHLGYVTTMAVEFSSAQVMLNTRVTAIGMSGDSKYASVRLESTSGGYTGSPVIEAQQLILATGIGKPTLFLPEKKNLADRLRTIAAPNPPPIMSFGEFVSRVNQDLRNKDNPMKPYVGKRILVVGAGDSAKVALEWLAGLGPSSESYMSAQIGEPKRIVWAGVDFLTCKEFLEGARSRYSRISSALNGAVVSLSPTRITNIQPGSSEKVIAVTQYKLKNKKDGSFGPDNLSQEDRNKIDEFVKRNVFFTTKGISTGDLKKKDQTLGDGTVNLQFEGDPTAEFDFLIDATGFRTETLGLLQAGFGKDKYPDGTQLSDIFVNVIETLGADANDLLRGTTQPIASQLRSGTGISSLLPIFAVGPANEQIFDKGLGKGLVSPKELAGVSANSVSLYANIIRTKKLPGAIAKISEPIFKKDKLTRGFDSEVRPLVTLASNGSPSPEVSFEISEIPGIRGTFARFPDNDDLEVGVRKILSGLKLEGDLEDFKIWIFLDQRKAPASRNTKTVSLRIEPGFEDDESRNTLINAINDDEPFKDLLFKMFPADSVASSGKNSSAARNFDESSKRILVVDEWEAGVAGQSPTKVRVSGKGTVRELAKATGIDLTKSVSSTQANKVSNTLIDILTQPSPLPVACLIFKMLDSDGFTLLRTDNQALAMTFLPNRSLTQGENRVDVIFNTTRDSANNTFPRNYDLDLILKFTREEFKRLYLGIQGFQFAPKEAFSLPIVGPANERLDYGGTFRNLAGSGLSPAPGFPRLPKFASIDESLNGIITVRPSSNPNILLMDVDEDQFTLSCTTDF
jgi:cation diffusion facilitator CzcD-associated flavoprotein CzcO